MRGYQKRVIFLKHTGSRLFDEAYFVVSPASEGATEGDMVLEANRIIEDNIKSARPEKGQKKKMYLYPFLLGTAVSAIISTVLFFVFRL